MRTTEERIPVRHADDLAHLVGAGRAAAMARDLAQSAMQLEGRTVWHVTTSSDLGGTQHATSVMAHQAGAGIHARWVRLHPDPETLDLLQRVAGLLGGGGLRELPDVTDHARFRSVGRRSAELLRRTMRRDDVVVLHGLLPASLAPWFAGRPRTVVWRCRAVAAGGDEATALGWGFLRPHVASATAVVAPCRVLPVDLPGAVHVVPVGVDPLATRNRHLTTATTREVLRRAGLVLPRRGDTVLQLTRWGDGVDVAGLLEAFAVAPHADLQLVVAGACPAGRRDATGRSLAQASWNALPARVRTRVHVVDLPSRPGAPPHGLVVNALQREATVVVDHRPAAGSGLSLIEAMWKSRPVVAITSPGAAAVVQHGATGLLVGERGTSLGSAVASLAADRRRADRLGDAGHGEVLAHRLVDVLVPAETGVLACTAAGP